MNNEYDYIVIGSGISGCYVANKLTTDFPNSKICIIAKDKELGGVWQQTKWSWLRSDTFAMFFTPDEYFQYVNSKYYMSTDGIKVKHLNKILRHQTLNIEIKLNTEVYSVHFSSKTNLWCVKTENGNFNCTFIINCTGLFRTPNIPDEYSKYLIKHHINFCHSSQFNDRDIDKDTKVAVIGSRESAFQIVKGLSKTNKVSWYARSFNNLYIDYNELSFNFVTTAIICSLFKSFFCLSKNVDNIYPMLHKLLEYKNKKSALYYINSFLTNRDFLHKLQINNDKYDFANPIKPIPINSKDLNYDNVQATQIKNNDCKSFLKRHDLIILATGYSYKEPFEIFIDDKKVDIDLFYLFKQVSDYKTPNMFFCLPYSDSSYLTLQMFYKRIKRLLENNHQVNKYEYKKYKQKINCFLKKMNVSKEEYMWNFKTSMFSNFYL